MQLHKLHWVVIMAGLLFVAGCSCDQEDESSQTGIQSDSAAIVGGKGYSHTPPTEDQEAEGKTEEISDSQVIATSPRAKMTVSACVISEIGNQTMFYDYDGTLNLNHLFINLKFD